MLNTRNNLPPTGRKLSHAKHENNLPPTGRQLSHAKHENNLPPTGRELSHAKHDEQPTTNFGDKPLSEGRCN